MRILKISICVVMSALSVVAAEQKYEANWDSLRQHKVPQWAKDAKFGIYAHWGIYAVMGSWNVDKNWGNNVICSYKGVYNKRMNDKRREFEKHIGPITDGWGYKDLAERFKAENVDPAGWAELVKKSGARYAGLCGVHHDGYCMWDSDVVDYCAGKLGPQRDLLGEILAEIKERGMKTFVSFHHSRTYKHFQRTAQGMRDDPELKDSVDLLDPENRRYYWFMTNKAQFAETRYKLTKEVIDKYKPDALWFDGGGGKFGTERVLADFFNMGLAEDKPVCIHNKGNFGQNFGVYSYENGHSRPLYVDWPWEDDTPSAIGWCDWPWFHSIEYKKPRDLVVRLCDLVARNGGLLLSLNPRPDGTFDPGQVELLEGIGNWLNQNGAAIYDTVPWKIFAEGHTNLLKYKQTRERNGAKSRWLQPDPDKLDWKDVRFTRNGEALYATVLGVPPSGIVEIKSLSSETSLSTDNQIESIELLGHGEVRWKRTAQDLKIKLPNDLPNPWALSFKISVQGELDKSKPPYNNTRMKLPKQT